MTPNLEVRYITQKRPLLKWTKEKLSASPFESWVLLSFPSDLPACLQKRESLQSSDFPNVNPASSYTQTKHTLQIWKAGTPQNPSQTTGQDKQEHTSQQSPQAPTSPPGPPHPTDLAGGHCSHHKEPQESSFIPPLTPSSPRSGSYLPPANAPLWCELSSMQTDAYSALPWLRAAPFSCFSHSPGHPGCDFF